MIGPPRFPVSDIILEGQTMLVPSGIRSLLRPSPAVISCLFLSVAFPVRAAGTGCGQVTLDKQISCGNDVFVDVGDVVSNEDGTAGCLGWTAHPGIEASEIKVRYVAINKGSVPLFDCVLTESNPAVSGAIDVGDLGPGASYIAIFSQLFCTETLDDHEPDTAVLSCRCTSGETADEEDRATASDSADFDCQTPGLGVTKICTPIEGGGAHVSISVHNSGDVELRECAITEELFEDDATCPADFGLATPLTPSLTAIAALPVGDDPVLVTASVPAIEADACNTVSVTCAVGETERTITVMADDVCESMLIEGCLTRSPGFWATHPAVTGGFLPLDACGITLLTADAGQPGSVTEDLCFSGRDFKAASTSPQQLQILRQCAAAALNMAATASEGGNCELAYPGINDVMQRCCTGADPACASAATGQEIGASDCIELLDAFNNSTDTLEPFGPFISPGPAQPGECKEARGNASVNAGRALGPPTASSPQKTMTIRGVRGKRR